LNCQADGRILADNGDVWEQSADKNIWTSETESNWRRKKLCSESLIGFNLLKLSRFK
jgi:hypothetical protein